MSNTLTLNDFSFQSYDKLRFADTDSQGHVNNSVFNVFLETGRAEFFYDPKDPVIPNDAFIVIAKLDLNFVAEVHWPGKVDIGSGIKKVGNSSVVLTQAVYQDDRLVATADTIIVQLDQETRGSHPWSEEQKERLGTFLIAD